MPKRKAKPPLKTITDLGGYASDENCIGLKGMNRYGIRTTGSTTDRFPAS